MTSWIYQLTLADSKALVSYTYKKFMFDTLNNPSKWFCPLSKLTHFCSIFKHKEKKNQCVVGLEKETEIQNKKNEKPSQHCILSQVKKEHFLLVWNWFFFPFVELFFSWFQPWFLLFFSVSFFTCFRWDMGNRVNKISLAPQFLPITLTTLLVLNQGLQSIWGYDVTCWSVVIWCELNNNQSDGKVS